jgi:uracil DNA glycosylase
MLLVDKRGHSDARASELSPEALLELFESIHNEYQKVLSLKAFTNKGVLLMKTVLPVQQGQARQSPS